MKLPIDIDGLLRGETVEWERLELKKGWNPKQVLHTVCAFANDFHNLGGGYVVIGVEEEEGLPKMPPAGIAADAIDAIQKEMLKLGKTAIRPSHVPQMVPYEIDGQHILVLWAPGGPSRPYRARKSLAKGKQELVGYIRRGSSTVEARGDDARELMSLAADVPFDDRVNQRAGIDDLSKELVVEFLEQIGSELADEAEHLTMLELGRQMQLVDGPDEAVFPRNVGLMFFNPDPRKFFPATQIDVVWFPAGPGGDTFTEKIFDGPLHVMVRDALEYIERLYLNETVIKHPDRAEATRVSNFPFDAVEEAVVNAVYHRSYEIREPVEVRIGREDLVVLSYPGPDRSVKLDRLREGRALSRRYRNRRIGEFLKELELTEGRGTGIPKILRAMKANGSPEPVFEFDEFHSYFQVTLPVHPDAAGEVTREAEEGGDWDNARRKVLSALEEKTEGLTNADVRDLTSLSRQDATRLLAGLRDEGLVQLVGHGRGARWKLGLEGD